MRENMKVSILAMLAMVLLFTAALASRGVAQETSSCGSAGGHHDEPEYGYPRLSPTQGPTGSSFRLSGTEATWKSNIEVWWDAFGSPQQLGTIVMDVNGNYIGDFAVPFDVADGTYGVVFWHTDREFIPQCLDYTVVAAVQNNAYTPVIEAREETPSVLPSTGLMLLVPAAGLASGAVGVAMLR